MGIFDSLKSLNPFSKNFAKNQEFEEGLMRQLEDNSVGMSTAEFESISNPNIIPQIQPGMDISDYLRSSISFNDTFESKKQKVAKYREMSYYPEISQAIDMVADEAIVEDQTGKICSLDIRKELPRKVEATFFREFEHIMTNVFTTKDNNIYDLFVKWLVESELYVEYILNDKKNAIIGYKALPSFTVSPVYSKSGNIEKFIQMKLDPVRGSINVPLERNQVCYIHWGKYGVDLLDVRGYLETSIRTYNHLKSLEDSLIVYRLVRAPERRVWNIEVGRLPTGKAEAYIRRMIHKYKKSVVYNTADGSVDATKNVQSLAEDFWFAKRDGQGTDVTTLQSGMNLGELDDVKLFLAKLYKSLKIPKTRWDPNIGATTYISGKDIEREELNFSLFVKRIQNRFKKLIKDAFIQHIRFKYSKDQTMRKYLYNSNIFEIKMNTANFFAEYKEMEMTEARMNIFSNALTNAVTPDNLSGPLSMEYIMRSPKYFGMTDEEYALNKKMRDREIEEFKKNQQDDMGGDSFGGDTGEETPQDNQDSEPETKEEPDNTDSEWLAGSDSEEDSNTDSEWLENDERMEDAIDNNKENLFPKQSAVEFLKRKRVTKKVM